MSLRFRVASRCLLLPWLLVLNFVTVPARARQPNLLIITIDDMSCDSVGVYGCKLAETTPNMDRLARRSMRLEHAHVQVGNCMPSRNVMWSGRYPHNNGVEGFYQVPQPSYPVLCDLVQQGGYFTAIRHKVSHSTPYSPYGWDLVLDTSADGTKLHVKDAESYGRSTARGIAAAKAVQKPFCVLINIADPHKPFYSEVKSGSDPHQPSRIFQADEVPVPGFLPDDPVVREELARYYSSVRRADDGVGAVLQALRSSGEEDNTILLFLADHGMPLPFAKTQLYHHSTRTPLMVRWPGVTKEAAVDAQHMVSAVDLLPTILDMLELPHPQELDGRSFAAVLKGQSQPGRDFVIKEYNENSGAKRNPMRAIQTREYLYLFNPWSNGQRKMATATNGTATYKRMIQLAAEDSDIAKRLQVADFRTVEELYKVDSDPDCLVNLINEDAYAPVANRLRQQMLKALQASGDPLAAVLQQRESAESMEAYMQRVQAEATARRAAKRKSQSQRNRKAQASRRPRHKIIQLDQSTFTRDQQTVAVELVCELPQELGTQKLHVTIKDSGGMRIERKTVEVQGDAKVQLHFALGDYPSGKSLSIAAFVGDDFATNLQHVQAKVQ